VIERYDKGCRRGNLNVIFMLFAVTKSYTAECPKIRMQRAFALKGYLSSVTLIDRVTDKNVTETEERMEKRWWQHVAENAGDQELLESLKQRAAMSDSSARLN
jgi:hypothetical protein